MDHVVLAVMAAVSAVGSSSFYAATTSAFRRAFKRDEATERARLSIEMAEVVDQSDSDLASVLERVFAVQDNQTPGTGTEAEREDISGKNDSSAKSNMPGPRLGKELFSPLLINYYAHGLTQARRSFTMSQTFSFLGGLVIIAGVVLAIFRANNDGQVYAGVVTSLAGALTSSIGVLFHQQSARALKHMEQQTNKLREDMNTERDEMAAIIMLEHVGSRELKSRLQAALILKFSRAELPDLGTWNNFDADSAKGDDEFRMPGKQPFTDRRADETD